ncbi:D-alanyl-D-alanine carboxypeptidase family protein [Oceanobacter mangrovi]|uniref:D-alanyl-D-alanine carboxypeptidase family protein n=1 Tax=Oceanobacter mangrovi TaxID=2862510 RepID=UPI001C8DE0F2|nr:D-alanyl-D-alanine carboxypeptidase family protein [Oceanobacter mangrovi]
MRLFASLFFVFGAAFSSAAVIVPSAPDLDARAYILVDAESGDVLVEHNADESLPPASLTKMMTSYIAAHELEKGNVKDSTLVPISVKAWRMAGSKMFVREGTEVPLIDLLRGIIVQSGNDASVAVAEYFAGSEDAFAGWMNQYALEMGMSNTHFMNATGWPAEGHHSSARDISKLALHIINDHPDYYELYSEKYYEYNDIRQPNRNKLLWRDPTVDGLKTGHTDSAGYCLAASAVRDDMRLIAVVMGTRSDDARAQETQKLLAYGFRYFKTHKLYEANKSLEQRKVWLGQQDQVQLGLQKDLYLTVPRGTEGDLDVELVTSEYLEAPIAAGQQIGKLTVKKDGELIAERPLVAINSVEESGFFGRLMGQIQLFFVRLLG